MAGRFAAEWLALAERVPKPFQHHRLIDDGDDLIDAPTFDLGLGNPDQIGEGLIGEANSLGIRDQQGFRRVLGRKLRGQRVRHGYPWESAPKIGSGATG